MSLNPTGAGHPAMTVTPSVTYTDDGQEIISYDNAEVFNHAEKQAIIEDFNNNNAQYISEDSMGNAQHYYELDEEESLRYSDDYAEELTSEDFIVDDLPSEEISFIQDQVGGAESYAKLMEWAEVNVHPDDIDAFNQIAETGTTEEILEALSNLYGVYVENYDDTYSDEESDYDEDQLQQEIDLEFTLLKEATPEGTEVALEQLQDAYDVQHESPEASLILQASAAFHRNDLSAEDAINMVIDQLGYERAIEVYDQLTR